MEAILDAVARVLKSHGASAVTTNRVAQAAGVSIGSLYQYFPDRQAIFVALRNRHVEEMGRLIERRLAAQAEAPLERLLESLLQAMIDAHALDPALYDLLLAHVPPGLNEPGEHEGRLQGALRLALAARAKELGSPAIVERALFVLGPMIETFAHAVVLRRPRTLSRHEAEVEAKKALIAYACSLPPSSRVARGAQRRLG